MFEWPSQSSDRNPIEYTWQDLKNGFNPTWQSFLPDRTDKNIRIQMCKSERNISQKMFVCNYRLRWFYKSIDPGYWYIFHLLVGLFNYPVCQNEKSNYLLSNVIICVNQMDRNLKCEISSASYKTLKSSSGEGGWIIMQDIVFKARRPFEFIKSVK